MNSRIMRNLRVKSSIARYLGEFVADRSDGGFIQGTQWLVWKFESDTTLADAMQASALHAASLPTQPAKPYLPCGAKVPAGETCLEAAAYWRVSCRQAPLAQFTRNSKHSPYCIDVSHKCNQRPHSPIADAVMMHDFKPTCF